MAEDGGRPGGLTVLAVLSFIWSGCLILGSVKLGIHALSAGERGADPSVVEIRLSALWTLVLGNLVCAGLLLVAGIGLIRQRRFLGRAMASIYAIFTLALLVVVEVIEPRLFGFGTVISVIYSLLFLLLVNSTFRRDLVR